MSKQITRSRIEQYTPIAHATLLVGILLLGAVSFSCSGSSNPSSTFTGTTTGTSSEGELSVGDVMVEVSGRGDGHGESPFGSSIVSARVRNESDLRVDVTLRFLRKQIIIHVAYLQVLPHSVTTVQSPEPVEQLEVSGVDEAGHVLPQQNFVYGVDFGVDDPADYEVPDSSYENPSPPSESPDTEPPVEPTYPERNVTLIEPAMDKSLQSGQILHTRWSDSEGAPNDLIIFGVRPVGALDLSAFRQIAPAVGLQFDGINDELEVVLQGLSVGSFEIVAVDGESAAVLAIAPGKIQIVPSVTNVAPTIQLLKPDATVMLPISGLFNITWSDHDPDDNATIEFALKTSDPFSANPISYTIGSPVAENPDGLTADGASIPLVGVLPGEYDLTATISDGKLIGTSLISKAVFVLPPPQNDLPTIAVVHPDKDVTATPSGSFTVQWTDSDSDQNATISIALDSLDDGSTDRIVLAASIAEDLDGEGDHLLLGVPASTPPGNYRVTGTISDGLATSVAWAVGKLKVVSAPSAPPDDPGPSNPPDDPIPEFAVLQPVGMSYLAVGDPITLQIDAVDVPSSGLASVVLSNIPFGGDLVADVTPPGFNLEVDDQYGLDTNGIISNSTWPRRFQVEVRLVIEDVSYSSIAPGVIWLYQVPQVVQVELVNVPCDETSLDPAEGFAGLKIVWQGGGFATAPDPMGAVEVWLTKDGEIPGSGSEDTTHKLVSTRPGNPGAPAIEKVPLIELMALEPGNYQVILVDQSPWSGSPSEGVATDTQMIAICGQTPDNHDTSETLFMDGDVSSHAPGGR